MRSSVNKLNDDELLARALGERLARWGRTLVAAESCTGGWIAKVITDVPGSSQWFERGFVTYSNTAKVEMLGVNPVTIAAHGAVSEATVSEMALGALTHSRGDFSVAVSGVAGPGGGSAEKPVGTVWIAWASDGQVSARQYLFTGERDEIRYAAVLEALRGVLERVSARF